MGKRSKKGGGNPVAAAPAGADASMDGATAPTGEDLDRLVGEALALVSAQSPEAAVPLLQQVLSADPTRAEAMDVLGEALLVTGDRDGAVQVLTSVLAAFIILMTLFGSCASWASHPVLTFFFFFFLFFFLFLYDSESIRIAPTGNPAKYMYMGQAHSGEESVAFYAEGIRLLAGRGQELQGEITSCT
jgi:hypothetical protein